MSKQTVSYASQHKTTGYVWFVIKLDVEGIKMLMPLNIFKKKGISSLLIYTRKEYGIICRIASLIGLYLYKKKRLPSDFRKWIIKRMWSMNNHCKMLFGSIALLFLRSFRGKESIIRSKKMSSKKSLRNKMEN